MEKKLLLAYRVFGAGVISGFVCFGLCLAYSFGSLVPAAFMVAFLPGPIGAFVLFDSMLRYKY